MPDDLDLSAYLNRIEYGGQTIPTLETLSGLLLAHTAKIPFENLDVLLGRPINIDLPGVQKKLVASKRGGYCFEHGALFAAVLEALGFEITRHAARVTLFFPRSQAPRTHMFLTVNLPEGRFVVDPGFGGLAPRFPVPVPGESELNPASASHSLVRDDRFYVLRVNDGEKIIDAWASTLEAENAVDYVLGNHFTSTHPSSQFVNRILLRAFSGDSIVSVMNRDVKISTVGHTEAFELADRKALRSLLNQHFGFDLPEVETMQVPTIPEWQA